MNENEKEEANREKEDECECWTKEEGSRETNTQRVHKENK